MTKKLSTITVIFLFISLVVFSNDYPTRVVNGKKYYEYSVQKSEGLFAIGRKFEVTQAQLLEANPQLEKQTGLKLGQIILVPIIQDNQDTYKEHLVQPKQTLYSLARTNGVTIEELVALNPELKNGLKAGQVIKIPIKSTKVAKPSKLNVVDESNIPAKRIITDSVPKLVNKEPIITDIISKPIDTESDNEKTTLKVALMLPLMSTSPDLEKISDKFIEFYKGILIALKNAKEMGVSVDMEVFDTEKSIDSLGSILHKPFFKEVDLIVGPAYEHQADTVLEFAQKNGIYTIIPFTSHLDRHNQNPYLIQFNPSFNELFQVMAEQIVSDLSKNKIIIARFQDTEDSKSDAFVNQLEEVLMEHKKNYNEFYITKDNIGTLSGLATKNGTLLVLASRNIDQVASFLPEIEALQIPKLAIWGYEEWGNEWLSYIPNTYYYSLFNKKSDTDYEDAYYQWFGKKGAISAPAYDMIGYDIMSYFISVWKKNHAQIFPFAKQNDVSLLQSDITFEQKSAAHKWINLNYYIFHFDGQQTSIIKK
ncbi:MAG: LysM peptidoglycan-binding domain-containing protein [Sphingobacteriia bacterium]|jgi:LysM repeat protein|nr:LysM peptidoglycan-binding domain-containing protein [Paludibacteraceae bacterium]NCA78857.1 LysM peptidoglycan-binding domain-containing protein [Sphingobacteriia bacterium]